MDGPSGSSQESSLLSKRKRGVRVLSLFDGIGSGFVALKNLGIPIDAYYYSEIEENAIRVAKMHFGGSTSLLGDIRDLDSLKLSFLTPIDLVIGGSPCNELSRVNAHRKGLNDPRGTGSLFYHFCRVLKTLEKLNCGVKFFWLFENVRNMEDKDVEAITEHLGVDPVMIDARKFTPMKRERLFWGNIPNMDVLESTPRTHSLTLQDFLAKNLNRKAKFECLNTVTSNPYSLLIDGLHPVTMDGKPDTVWITELEALFGFPPNYTNLGGRLSYNEQLRLLAKAWCVQVIEALLKPLVPLFEENGRPFLRCTPVLAKYREKQIEARNQNKKKEKGRKRKAGKGHLAD